MNGRWILFPFAIGLGFAPAFAQEQSLEKAESPQPAIKWTNPFQGNFPTLIKEGKPVRVSVDEFIEAKLKDATGKYYPVSVPDG